MENGAADPTTIGMFSTRRRRNVNDLVIGTIGLGTKNGRLDETLVIGVFLVGVNTVPINETGVQSNEVEVVGVGRRDDGLLTGRDRETETVEIRVLGGRNPSPKINQ